MASATGSAGTIASGDYMKKLFPDSKIVASEALQCPTLLENGFGAHRIEGIGDKHVPWIHNTKNTDVITAIDDNAVVNIARLFNEENGRAYLAEKPELRAALQARQAERRAFRAANPQAEAVIRARIEQRRANLRPAPVDGALEGNADPAR